MPSKLDYFLNGNKDGKTDKERNGRKVTETGKPFNIWSFENKQKWFVEEDDMPEFYKLYCDDIRNCIPQYLTEKSTTIGQLRVDLDFKYEGQVDEHKHTQEQVSSFVSAYMEEVKKYLVVPEKVEVYILEKDRPTYDRAKNVSSSGIHIQVPEVKTSAGVEQSIRRVLVRRMDEFFPSLGLLKGWDDVYDKSPLTHTNNWPILGSKKTGEESLPYQIRYVLEWASGTITKKDGPMGINVDLVRKMSVRSKQSEETELTEEGKKKIHQPSEQQVVVVSGGRALSAPRGRPTTRGEHDSRGSSPGRVYVQPLSDEQQKYIKSHVENLAEFRYTNYNDWIAVGQCLKNIHPDLEDVWLDFSERIGDSYDEGKCRKQWNYFGYRIDGQRLGIGSLRHWSAQDNLEGYKKIEEGNVERLIEKSAESGTENDVAQVVYALYRDEFKCARFGANEWYRYTGHTWRTTDKGIALQCRLSKDIADRYIRMEQQEMLSILTIGECDHKVPEASCECCKHEVKKKAYSSIRLKLKTSRFKENVMKECRELFLDEELALKLDENKHLIAFNNGVFDTLTMEFRDGKPDDYISFCTGIDFALDTQYHEFECWAELELFLRSILPNKNVREYFLRHLSTCLSGTNEAQKFHILTGSGSNGKSMLMNLVATAFGEYCYKANISMLTQKRGKSGAAAPEIVRMKGRRFVTMQEPDEGEALSTGVMKELSSSEKITARDLYAGSKSMVEFDIQAKFHLACNDKPKVNTNDGGTWRRLVVIDFPSKFVHDPKLPNELPIDETIVQKVIGEEWATCFMAYMVHIYKEGNGWRKLAPPLEVMAYTNEYKEESDVIARFMRDYIHPLGDTTGQDPEVDDAQPVSKTAITSQFQEWKRQNDLNTQGSSTQLLFKRIEAEYGKFVKPGWISFRFGPV